MQNNQVGKEFIISMRELEINWQCHNLLDSIYVHHASQPPKESIIVIIKLILE